jgi:hypothetical protein
MNRVAIISENNSKAVLMLIVEKLMLNDISFFFSKNQNTIFALSDMRTIRCLLGFKFINALEIELKKEHINSIL